MSKSSPVYPRKFVSLPGHSGVVASIIYPGPGEKGNGTQKDGSHVECVSESHFLSVCMPSGDWQEVFDHHPEHSAQLKRDRELLLRSIARNLRDQNRKLREALELALSSGKNRTKNKLKAREILNGLGA